MIPGGVDSPVRAFGSVGGTPVFPARGDGAWITDVEGARYVDLVQSWGALLFGHAHPAIVAAATEAASRGTSFGMPTEAEVELATRIVEAVPSVEIGTARVLGNRGRDVGGARSRAVSPAATCS